MTERGTERERTRRRFLWGVGASGAVAFAGCTDGGDPRSGDDSGSGDDTTDGSGSDDGDEPDDGDADDGSTDDLVTAVHQTGGALTGPAWDPEVRRGFCVLFRDAGEASWLLRDADAETRAFVEETDFGASALAYAESIGPTTCHNEIAFADVAVQDGVLVGDAAVENTAGDNEACGEAITYPGALLRVTVDPLPDAIRLSITDGWGETSVVTGEDGVSDSEALPGGVRPDGEPAVIPTEFECETDGFERHPQAYEGAVNWGGGSDVDDGDSNGDADSDDRTGGPLALRVVIPGDDGGGDGSDSALTIARGTGFRIELTNVSGRLTYVGNRGKYNLELRTGSGWTEIRGTDGDAAFVYTDEALAIRPGETLSWVFEMTETGLVENGPHADALRVCPDLVPGRYRFVFWGADDLAVAFDYEG
ncbi:hypothetical protein [Halorubrum sp. DTA46]|uniref:hypothetical protein n=1 Tax=Halorubrum sp. DTA46 TaxID=3402162 RepID=UPI003AB0D18C